MKWNAWGDPAAAKPLSDSIRGLLTAALGIDAAPAPELEADPEELEERHLALRRCLQRLRPQDRDLIHHRFALRSSCQTQPPPPSRPVRT